MDTYCPENKRGAWLSRNLDICVVWTQTVAAAGNGIMHVDSGAKPLVPYPVGISGQGIARQPTRSRLANSHVTDGPPGQLRDIHDCVFSLAAT